MTATLRRTKHRATQARPHPGHSKARCLKILRHLSAYLDDELTLGVCDEIRKHLGACPKCEVFVQSLRQTVSLCRHAETRPLSPGLKARIRQQVFKAAGLL
ncbi:MAG: anti-sigma factor family protein [Nitrospirales bacterium]